MTRRKVRIQIIRETTLPVDRIEEWVGANHFPGDQVMVADAETGETYYDKTDREEL